MTFREVSDSTHEIRIRWCKSKRENLADKTIPGKSDTTKTESKNSPK